MTIQEAFEDLIKHWEDIPKHFRNKYRYYKSVHKTSTRNVTESKMREMLLEAGYKETWTTKKS